MSLDKDQFAEQVRDALLHLYDVAYLPRLEISAVLAGEAALGWDERAQLARRRLIQAIDRLDPGSRFSRLERERRPYDALHTRYVRSMSVPDIVNELAISERQFWREHKRGVDALTDLLWEEYAQATATLQQSPTLPRPVSHSIDEELKLLASSSSPEPVNMVNLVNQVTGDFAEVATRKHVQIVLDMPSHPVSAFIDRGILRQICLNLLSHAIKTSQTGMIHVKLQVEQETTQLEISTTLQQEHETPARETETGLDIARRLAQALALDIRTQNDPEGHWLAILCLHASEFVPVLVIEDNETAIKLLKRYLTGTRYYVLEADSGDAAVHTASQYQPAAILLDVMMPKQDGWEVLKMLKAAPQACGIPVVVCSVLNEPDLALSLGAEAFIQKPISRFDLLQTLDRWTG